MSGRALSTQAHESAACFGCDLLQFLRILRLTLPNDDAPPAKFAKRPLMKFIASGVAVELREPPFHDDSSASCSSCRLDVDARNSRGAKTGGPKLGGQGAKTGVRVQILTTLPRTFLILAAVSCPQSLARRSCWLTLAGLPMRKRSLGRDRKLQLQTGGAGLWGGGCG